MTLTAEMEQTAARPIAWTLQAEGLAVAAIAIFGYAQMGGNWALFALLILTPDLTMLGYLRDNKLAALSYNLSHSYLGPLTLGLAGYLMHAPLALQIALIWTAHIGLDRAIGYGLKYASGFKQTHLDRL